jgi:hypothetical protein
MKVEVNEGWQVVDADGKLQTSGTIEMDDGEARQAIAAGWVSEPKGGKVKPRPAYQSNKRDADVSQYHTGGGWYEIEGERYRGEDAAREALAKGKKAPAARNKKQTVADNK